jgi:hypothetical protein
MSTPDDKDEPREVLSSLPRSRRQRPSARREAARAGRTPAAKAPAKPKAAASKPRATATKAKPAPKPRKKPVPVAQSRRTSPAKTSVIPPAGYATPREGSGRGSADPAAALVGLAKGIRGLLPF